MDDVLSVAGQVLAKVAPMLATAFGGPLAGAATGAIISALGLAPDASKEAVAAAIASATPDQLLALKKADQDFTIAMGRLNLDAAALEGKDRDSARQRETVVRDWMPRALGLGVVAAFIGVVAFVIGGYSHVDTVLAGTLIGYLSAKAEQVIAYYFGSSAGSQAKDRLLLNSVPAS